MVQLQIQIVDDTGFAVKSANVSLQTLGILPIEKLSDDNGITLFDVPNSVLKQSAQVQVTKAGYISSNEFIVLETDSDKKIILQREATPTPTEILTNTPTPTLDPPTNTPTPVSGIVITDTIDTPTTTATPTATPDPTIATITTNTSLFYDPDAFSQVLRTLNATEQVKVLGHTPDNAWLYVRYLADDTFEGFVQLRVTSWSNSEELGTLLTMVPTINSIPTPTPQAVIEDLVIDFYPLSGTERCDGAIWEKDLYLAGRGGNGNYTYFLNDVEVIDDDPNDTGVVIAVRNSGGGILVMGTVVSGDGQIAKRELLVQAHACP